MAGGTSTISSPLAQDVYFGIRMRVRNVVGPGPESDGGTCHHIAIDNTLYDKVTHQPAWKNLTTNNDLAVRLVDIQELLGPHGCGQISDKLTVLFTAAHPNLGSVSLEMDGPGEPVGGYQFTLDSSRRVEFLRLLWDSDAEWVRRGEAQAVCLPRDPHGRRVADRRRQLPDPLYDQIAFCKE